ncbi:MAG: hypothetical protein O3A46_07445 [Candidatus Poribacteria bacterium]|nr:hypothetical protein [Candidatus Poribacteria bacterium]
MMIAWLIAATFASTEPPYPVDVTERTLVDPNEVARLETPGTVFFADGFESESSLDAWYGIIGADDGRTKIVSDDALSHTGSGSLQMTTPDRNGNEASSGANVWFHPGYDTVYFRRYIRFAEDYDQGNLNHVGGRLYAVAGDDRWAQMGKAGLKPDGDDRFGAGFEPWIDWRRYDPPGAMMLYTYWMDMKGERDGKYWGNNLFPPDERRVALERGKWVCLEQMIRANTPGQADGEMAAWVDGQLYIHYKGFRWRTTPDLKIKRATIELYVHQSRRENRVWYDDVALSTGYIGTK